MWIQFSDSVENNVGKGEIACYKLFLLFPQCFQKLSVVDSSKTLYHTVLTFNNLKTEGSGKHYAKRRKC